MFCAGWNVEPQTKLLLLLLLLPLLCVWLRSVERLYRARSPLDLVGKHIHIQSGAWTEATAGIGFNADSFYEYTLKASLLFGDQRYKAMFDVLYSAVRSKPIKLSTVPPDKTINCVLPRAADSPGGSL